SLTLRVDHELSNVSLVSISGYLDQEQGNISDADQSSVPLINGSFATTNEQVSQEFQFLSNNDGPTSWVAGLYYLRADHSYDPLRLYGLAFAGLQYLDSRTTVEATAYAAFAEVSHYFTDTLKVTVGGRWSYDEK